MALETLKKLWKNEYFQTVITVVLLLGFVFGSWYIIQKALRTEYPALAVASGSMLPTLNVGDLIIVQGIDPEEINAVPLTGDIIVFKKSNDDLVVHRAIEKISGTDGYLFVTKGDNNPSPDSEKVNEKDIIGRVVGRIPWIGNFALLLHSQQNIYLFTIIFIILVIIFLLFPFETEEEEKKESEEMLFFGKIPLKMIYLIILNIFLICLIIFSLWGTFTFWNPGANSNPVTIYGMFSDVYFHKAKTHSPEVFLSQGFLTYTIDCQLSSGELQTGVPTFSWSQATIILLILLDAWKLRKILRTCGRLKPKQGQETA